MKQLLAVVRLAACASLLCAGLVIAAGVAGVQRAGATERTVTIAVEYYGWYTNSPPGCQTADPSIRDGCAGGKGTYTTPITAAVDPTDYPYGTLFYYPAEKRYFEAGDLDPGGSFTALTWWMGYLGTSTATTAGTPFGLIDCEDALTVTKTGTTALTPVIVTPPDGLPVTTQPLFTYVTSRCYGGATSPATFNQYKSETKGLCIENPTFGTTVGRVAKLTTCKTYTAKTKTSEGEDLEYEGNWFFNHGLCLKKVRGSTPIWTKCIGETTKEYWYTGLKFPGTDNKWTTVAEPPMGLPSAPGKPTAIPGNTRATVSWAASASKGTFTIERYTVTASPGGGWCTTTGLSCTVGTLSNGVSYTFTVRAWSYAGTSPASAASTPITVTPSAFRGANLKGADLAGANLAGCNMAGANLQGANLQGADLEGTNLQGANLQGASLRDDTLQEASLQGDNLQGANLTDADLKQANLQGSNLQGANLTDADLQQANLQGSNLQGAMLPSADLQGANLRGANLQTADLAGDTLQGDTLQGANLQRANLTDADLAHANLSGANLRTAVLTGATL